ncbi:ParA family protein [Streptomyces sp. NPDC018059]|uniref:ParA family protein n=1 Tax=Streptomyces sp. NPDC018059 TaxID=3365041 RepID=UPI0037A67BD9
MTTLPPGYIPFSEVLAAGPLPGEARIFAMVNQSGGAGKTTSAVNIAASAAEYGWRTLIVDGDAQCDASVACGYEPDRLEGQATLYDVLLGVANFEDTIVPALAGAFGAKGTVAIENLYIALASEQLEDAEQMLATRVGREFWLRGLIDTVRGMFDLIIIDCPGNLGLYVVNAIVASDEVIGCVKPGWKELRALTRIELKIEELQRVLAGVKAFLGKVLVVDVPTTRSQGAVYDDSRKSVASAYTDRMLPTVRRSPRIPESYAAQKVLRIFDRTGEATQNYYDITKALGFPRRKQR